MTFKVLVTASAACDLEGIYDYILHSESALAANDVLSKIESVIAKLETFPDRGTCPPEVESLGLLGFREVIAAPHRLIYRVD